MTREISHFQMFSAALETIQPNFPPGILQGDPRYKHMVFNMSDGAGARGPWNEGQGPWAEGEWVYVENPLQRVLQTDGLLEQPVEGTAQTIEEAENMGMELGKIRSQEIKAATSTDGNGSQWSSYPQQNIAGPETVVSTKTKSNRE